MPLTELNHYFVRSKDLERSHSGVVDHIAFMATEPEKFSQRFGEAGLPSRSRYIAQIQLFQIFVTDPDGLTSELNLPDVAVKPAWA